MDLLNFSLNDNNQDPFTPIRPHKIEQLFSPSTLKIRTPTSNLTAKIPINDVTYQVPVKSYANDNGIGANTKLLLPPPPILPVIDKYSDIGLPTPKNPNYFPRCSTGLKGPYPPPAGLNESVDSNISLENSSPLLKDEFGVKQELLAATVDEQLTIPQYKPFHQIKDLQPIRATCFHPTGDVYIVGTNSRKLLICNYPSEQELKQFSKDTSDLGKYPHEPEYAYQFLQLHRSSIYCAAFNESGTLLATGSNDTIVHIVQYDADKQLPKSNEFKLSQHTGTVRDVIFMPNNSTATDGTASATSIGSNQCYLISAGAGENEIIITDCHDMKPLRILKGHHESAIMSLHKWQDANCFVSGSLDGTIKLWDVRSNLCCSTIKSVRTSEQSIGHLSKEPVGVVRVDNSGKLLVSGHRDGQCMMYDIRGGRIIQLFKAHEGEIRTLNFSPKSYYLLTAGYDNKIKLMDLQGELTRKLPCVELGELRDKCVQTAWHPSEYTFVTTCADGTATLWAMPDTILTSLSSDDYL